MSSNFCHVLKHMIVIDFAKEKILNPSYSISQVAYELGFQYPQHLTRLFKNIVGQTPNEYRAMNKGVKTNA